MFYALNQFINILFQEGKMELIIDEDNELLREVYCHNFNYRVVDSEICDNNKCIVFFSGNGLYYPDTMEEFKTTIVESDRYEWMRIGLSVEIQSHFSRIVFVRDIYKTWYEKGINSTTDSVDKLILLLKDICKGYEVTTCGNSAGGYIAAIVCNEINGKCAWNFGGQWIVNTRFCKRYAEDKDVSKYYDITRFATSKVFYFYSALNDRDIDQYKEIENTKAICLPVKSKYHGDLLFNKCYCRLLCLNDEEISRIINKYRNSITTQRKYACSILKGKELYKELCNDLVRRHKSLQIVFGRKTNIMKEKSR